MQMTFLGTGAAEAIPDPFCSCRVCEIARREGGPHVRARSAALVNEDLLIDLGPDILTSANQARAFLGGLKGLLITHRHSDHWLPQNLYWRRAGFTPTEMVPLTVYGPADAMADLTPDFGEAAHFTWKTVAAGDRWELGSYTITAVPATHGGGMLEPLLYVIEQAGKKLFYATDTAPLGEAAWEVLAPLGPMDVIALDATTGLLPGGDGHHSFDAFVDTRAELIHRGVMVPGKTVLIAHHFSHNGLFTHDELVAAYGAYGVDVAYDGMEVGIGEKG
ncbi:MAG: hypothetical protein JXC32_07370 [Anaerolineae bacterium]|nr:hypothetical protein [Anaerolineae bacterium]